MLHALRDVRQVDPHEGRDRLNVAEPIPTLPASTAAPIAAGWGDPVPGRVFPPAVVQRFSRRTANACLRQQPDTAAHRRAGFLLGGACDKNTNCLRQLDKLMNVRSLISELVKSVGKP